MNKSENLPAQEEPVKARLLNRVIARAVDFIIAGVLLEAIPRAGFFAGLAYILIADGLFEGRSIGKRLIRLKVVLSETGQTCSFKESIIRNFAFAAGYILMMIPLIGFIFPVLIVFFEGLIMIGNEKGMRFGDELAKTRVVEGENAG